MLLMQCYPEHRCTRYEQPVTDARLYSKQSKCVFCRDWTAVYFELLDAHFPDISFAKIACPKPATETIEVKRFSRCKSFKKMGKTVKSETNANT
jgi:hypothetical protein